MKPIVYCVLLSSLLACSQSSKNSLVNSGVIEKQVSMPEFLADSNFGDPISIIEPSKLFELSPSQIKSFQEFAERPEYQDFESNKIVGEYLKSHLKNFNYYSDTLRAEESLIKQQGNCLSLAILTKALANLNNIEITYQLVETPPVFQKEGNIILSSQHVRTKLLNPIVESSDNKLVFSRGGVTIDYFPERGSYILRNIEEPEFFGMYYRNKAAEALINEDLNSAFWLVKKNLQLSPADPHGLNMMALIHYKKGAYDIAEKLYEYGLQTNEDKLDLLGNYHSLLLRLDKKEKANLIAKRLERQENKNPFKWISLASKAYNDRNFRHALKYYQKAKNLAPYLHQAYAGLAQTQAQLGNLKSAQNDLEQALEKAYTKDAKALYQSKIEMLNQLLSKGKYKE